MRDQEFIKKWPAFKAWLQNNGLQVFENTQNPYELARFATSEGVGVVYRNKANNVSSMTNGADKLWLAFLKNSPASVSLKTPRRRRSDQERRRLVQELAGRDGWGCMFCGAELNSQTATIEHIVPLGTKGIEHSSNMTLACSACNQRAGHLSAREKIEMALKLRAKTNARAN